MKCLRFCAAMLIALSCIPHAFAQTDVDSGDRDALLLPVFDSPPDATGMASFQQTDTQSRFDVTIQDVPLGEYELRVDGQFRGTFFTNGTHANSSGTISFFDPVLETGQRRLSFEATGVIVEVFPSARDVVLTSLFPKGADRPILSGIVPPGLAPDPGDDRLDGFRKVRTSAIMTRPRSTIAGQRGIVTLNSRPGRVTIVFSFQKIPQGAYTLCANGLPFAELEAGKNGSAKLVFNTSPTTGQQLLDFDPSNTMYELFLLDAPDETPEQPELVLRGMVRGSDLQGGLQQIGTAGEILEPITLDSSQPERRAVIALAVSTAEQVLDVELINVEPGTWTLRVDGRLAARFPVEDLLTDEDDAVNRPEQLPTIEDDATPEPASFGFIRLSTNPLPVEQPIIFDPLGAQVEILSPDGTVVFKTRLAGSMTMEEPDLP